MYVDAFLVGHYAPLHGFELWPTFAVLAANALSNLNTGGLKLELVALGWSALGACLTATAYQVSFTPESNLLTSFLSMAFVLAYLGIVSSSANRWMTEVRRTKLKVEEQNRQITGFADELKERVDEQTRELKIANEKLAKADHLKDEFLANTSHELRTPLNGIIGLTEAMLDGSDGDLRPSLRAKMLMIVASGRRLASLVNDLLDFSKLKHHELGLNVKSVDLRSVVEVVLAVSSHLVLMKGLRLLNDVPEGTTVQADENRLQQILYNLVGNAIKFTDRGAVQISADVEALTGNVITHVSDTGIGIAADQIDRIFESFEQGDGSTSRQYGGTGIGLAITRKLLDLHGGSVSVRSTVGEGSTFSFVLPVGDASEVEREPTRGANNVARDDSFTALLGTSERLSVKLQVAQAVPPRGHASLYNLKTAAITPSNAPPPIVRTRPIRILAADDDPVNMEVLRSQLEPEGFEVVQASDGAEALRKFEREGPFDAALLDVMMPRMTGYEVCRKIRESFSAAELPVVLLTAKNRVSDLVHGFDSGANDYLNKPFSKKELLARINSHLTVTRTNSAFGRFVPREFLKLLGRNNVVDVALGDNVELSMTVLFSDIRNFTTLAEAMTPAETFDFVNGCLSQIGPEIRLNHGFIDKFIGDAVMALFPNTPTDAIFAAVGIQRQVSRYNSRTEARRFPLSVGVGLHTGPTMLGTIGDNERFEATVISDTVNLASRVEGLTKYLGAKVIVTSVVTDGLPEGHEFSLRYIGSVKVKGKARAVGLSEVLDAEDEPARLAKEANRPLFERSVQRYAAGEFQDALQGFDAVLKANQADGAAAFLSRLCRKVIKDGPPDDFDGTVSFEVK